MVLSMIDLTTLEGMDTPKKGRTTMLQSYSPSYKSF